MQSNKKMSRNHKIYYDLFYLNTYFFICFISLLFIIPVNPILKSRCKHILFLKSNQISLKVKGSGTISIINSGFSPKPSSYYKVNETNPKTISGSTIEFSNTENEVTLIFTSSVTTCCSMFKGCSKITEIDLTNFVSDNVRNIDYMFYGYTSLKSIKFGNFKTSKVNHMEYAFYNCESLETLDLSNFDTSKVNDFHYMFYNCRSLKYLDLSNFNTASCTCTHNMFEGCTSITSINLSSFDTSKVNLMNHMFYNCKNLVSLDLSSFDTSYTQHMEYMFYGCEKLEFVNFNKARISNINHYENMTTNTAKNIVFCAYGSLAGILNLLEESNGCAIRITDCSNWRNRQKKIICEQNDSINSCSLISQNYKCIDNYEMADIYMYKFKQIFYKQCPSNISRESQTKSNYCEPICPKEHPYEIIETQECVDQCSISERQKGLCKINYQPEENNANSEANKEIEEKVVENIKEELTKDFDTSDIDKGENIVIKQKDSTITISTTENQKNEKNNNVSTINLGDCENKIKDEYNISRDKSLYILKIDVRQEGLKIPKIEYEVYYPLFGDSLIKLNLTVCKNSKIELSIPVSLTESLDKINSSSEYYNDICYTITSENGTDISLSDRKKEFINNNLTVCEEDCDFSEYNYTTGKAMCSCKVKTKSTAKVAGVSIDKNKLYENFIDIKNIVNINVLKCYKLIFTLNAFKSNYANLILLVIILLFLICLILFYFKDYYYLLKILSIIVYFKLNPILVKKLNHREKKEKKKEEKKYKTNQNTFNESNINLFLPKKKVKKRSKNKQKDSNNNNKSVKNLPHPIHLKYINLKISNPIKKKNLSVLNKIKIKNEKNSNKKLNYLQTKNITSKKIIIIDNAMKFKLSKENLYEMFLLIVNYTDSELNTLSYKKALKIDKRKFCNYYYSLILTKHLLFFSFFPVFDYNSQIIKIFLFFFNFTVNFVINALFFNDDTMHKIYTDGGSFNFIYNIPQIIYSSLISEFILAIITIFALSDTYFIQLRYYTNNKMNIRIKAKNIIRILKIKFALFFVINFILLVLFWFYLACFCAVYKNTQIHLINDTLISFGTSMIYPFGIYVIPGIFRTFALKHKNKKCMYNFSKIVEIV